MAREFTPGRRTKDFTAVGITNELGWVGDYVPRDNLAAAYLLGTSYPGPKPEYDYSLAKAQIGALTIIGATPGTTKLACGSLAYGEMPWSVQDIKGASGFSGFVVGEFVANNSAFMSTFSATEAFGWGLHKLNTGAYRVGTYQSGTDYFAELASTGYSGAGNPETLYFDISDTLLRLWHYQPGQAVRKVTAANSIAVASLGSNLIRLGRSRGNSFNADTNIYTGCIFKDLYASDAAVDTLHQTVKAFMADRVSVTI